jgi:hypothetical protein
MTFKRGDWVRWSHGEPACVHPHSLYLKDLGDGFARIQDEEGDSFTVVASQLSADEAPE